MTTETSLGALDCSHQPDVNRRRDVEVPFAGPRLAAGMRVVVTGTYMPGATGMIRYSMHPVGHVDRWAVVLDPECCPPGARTLTADFSGHELRRGTRLRREVSA